jgi:hypothetical protein
MATTKVIKDLTELNPGDPDYVLNATNAVTVSSASGSNKYYFNGVYDGKFGLRKGTTVLTGVPVAHPIAVLNNGLTGITYTGTFFNTLVVGGVTYNFYTGDVTITVTADFGVASYYCYYHGYMGGENNLVSVYSTAGLKMPTGSSAYAAPPTVAQGMMRNLGGTASEGSVSVMQHYNGTEWKNFVNTIQCTTTNCSYPTTNLALYELNSNSNNSSTCATSGSYNGADSNITYAAGKFGNAAVFNGTSSVISLGTSSNFSITTTGALSGSMWVKTTDTSTSYLISKANDSPPGNYEWAVEYGAPTGKMKLNVYTDADGFAASVTNNTTVNDGNWHHLAFVIVNNTDAVGGSVSLYIDGGTPATSTSWSGTAASFSIPTLIGHFGGISAATAWWNGSIDQVRFFTSALNQTQVDELVNEVGC